MISVRRRLQSELDYLGLIAFAELQHYLNHEEEGVAIQPSCEL